LKVSENHLLGTPEHQVDWALGVLEGELVIIVTVGGVSLLPLPLRGCGIRLLLLLLAVLQELLC
jgi:hypothetical protein